MICGSCKSENSENSKFCNLCGKELGKSELKTSRMITNFAIGIGLIVAIAVVALSLLYVFFGGPSDEIVQKTLQEQYGQVRVIQKIKCDNIPSEIKIYGVSEAWLVRFEQADFTQTITSYYKTNGEWGHAWETKCP